MSISPNLVAMKPLLDIINILEDPERRKDQLSRVTLLSDFENCIKCIKDSTIDVIEFGSFLNRVHDIVISCEPSLRCLYFRAIRYCISGHDHCCKLVDEEFHWIIVTSLEHEDNDQYYLQERIQALKIVVKVAESCTLVFPVAFTRSVISIASQKDDSFSGLCLEILRQLALANPQLVGECNGIKPLFDAVLDPDCKDSTEIIMLSLLYLLNKPESRKCIRNQLDLQALLAPLTDLDTPPADLLPRRYAAHRALLLCLRSWAGIALLASDDMALPTLVKMLRDPKVSRQAQDSILDLFQSAFDPITSKRKATASRAVSSATTASMGGDIGPVMAAMSTVGSGAPPLAAPRAAHKDSKPSSTFASVTKGIKRRTNSVTEGMGLAASVSESSSLHSSHGGSWGVSELLSSVRGASSSYSSSVPGSISPRSSSNRHSSLSSVTGVPRTPSPAPSPSPSPASHGMTYPSTPDSAATPNSASAKEKKNWLAGGASSNRKEGGRSVSTATSGIGDDYSSIQSIADELNPRALSGASVSLTTLSAEMSEPSEEFDRDNDVDASYTSGIFRRQSLSVPPLHLDSLAGSYLGPAPGQGVTTSGSTAAVGQTAASSAGRVDLIDPQYNVIDGYSAYLCTAFLHSNIVESLVYLSTSPDAILVQKSRLLLVDIMRVVATVLPERWSSELLISPSLIQFASSIQSQAKPSRAHKATLMLTALADAFSAMSFPGAKLPSPRPVTISLSPASPISGSSARPNGPKTPAPGSESGRELAAMAREAANSSFESWTLEDLCVEVVQASSMRIYGGQYADFLQDLKQAMVMKCTQQELHKQLESSRVTGKEAWRWDWAVIGEMLEYSFQNRERFADALKTKWVKRVSQFYFCKGENKAIFPNVDWQPNNLIYMEYGIRLFRTFSMNIPVETNYLDPDRGTLFCRELAKELMLLIEGRQKKLTATGVKTLFKVGVIHQTLVREYFCIIGQMTTTPAGKRMVEDSLIPQYLLSMGRYDSLDYMSRTALCGLIFTDKGYISNGLLQAWLMPGGCSSDLRLYSLHILRALLRSQPEEFHRWGFDVLASLLGSATSEPLRCGDEILRILIEACNDPSALQVLISKKLPISCFTRIRNADQFLQRFVRIPEGLDYLIQNRWLGPAISRWAESMCLDYGTTIEGRLSEALAGTIRSTSQTSGSRPIPLRMSALPGSGSSGVFGGIQLEGLIRLPWNIEVRVYNAKNEVESLRLDCYIDMSAFPSRQCEDTVCDDVRLVRVRGLILDPSSGLPTGHAIAPDKHIKATLLCGVCPVLRDGTVLSPSTECFSSREKSSKSASPPRVRSSQSLSTAAESTASVDGGMENQMYQTRPGEAQHDWLFCPPSHRKSIPSNNSQLLSVKSAHGGSSTKSEVQASYQVSHIELGDDKVAVHVSGEPVRWIFSRTARQAVTPVAALSSVFAKGMDRARSINAMNLSLPPVPPSGKPPPAGIQLTNASVPTLYLEEVQFLMNIRTEQSIMVPLPRHLYGDLASSSKGLSMLSTEDIGDGASPSPLSSPTAADVAYFPYVFRDFPSFTSPFSLDTSDDNMSSVSVKKREGIVSRLLQTALNDQLDGSARRAALWALGNIAAASDLACELVLQYCPLFLHWLTDQALMSADFSLRGTCFMVCGLFGRTKAGAMKLQKLQWECCPLNVHISVATPRQLSSMFAPLKEGSLLESTDRTFLPNSHKSLGNPRSIPQTSGSSVSSSLAINAFSFFPNLTPAEREVVELIAKLPGHLQYKESSARLESLKLQCPLLFQSRDVYLATRELFTRFQFKLAIRRKVNAMFGPAAKVKNDMREGVGDSEEAQNNHE